MAEEAAAVAEAEPVVEATPAAAEPAAKTFSEDDVNRIVQERLARATKGQPSADELAELKRKATALDEAEAANQTEFEREKNAREAAERENATLKAQAEATRIEVAATTELAKQGVTNIDGALRALDKTGLTVGDDGTVSGVSEAVTALLEGIPEFVGKTGGAKPSPVDQGARGTGTKDGQVTAAQLETMSAEEIAKATTEGRMADLLS